jgi:hypothetical protein
MRFQGDSSMNAKSMISGIALLASASALPFSAACASTTITFDDLPPTGVPNLSRAIANGYQGLDWTNFQHTDPVALLERFAFSLHRTHNW